MIARAPSPPGRFGTIAITDVPGLPADFTEYNGGHDKACRRVDLPHGLIALTEDHTR